MNIPVIKIGDITVKSTDHMKFLSILIDNNLNFDYHVRYISYI